MKYKTSPKLNETFSEFNLFLYSWTPHFSYLSKKWIKFSKSEEKLLDIYSNEADYGTKEMHFPTSYSIGYSTEPSVEGTFPSTYVRTYHDVF